VTALSVFSIEGVAASIEKEADGQVATMQQPFAHRHLVDDGQTSSGVSALGDVAFNCRSL
jgi:hypothetical protein